MCTTKAVFKKGANKLLEKLIDPDGMKRRVWVLSALFGALRFLILSYGWLCCIILLSDEIAAEPERSQGSRKNNL